MYFRNEHPKVMTVSLMALFLKDSSGSQSKQSTGTTRTSIVQCKALLRMHASGRRGPHVRPTKNCVKKTGSLRLPRVERRGGRIGERQCAVPPARRCCAWGAMQRQGYLRRCRPMGAVPHEAASQWTRRLFAAAAAHPIPVPRRKSASGEDLTRCTFSSLFRSLRARTAVAHIQLTKQN